MRVKNKRTLRRMHRKWSFSSKSPRNTRARSKSRSHKQSNSRSKSSTRSEWRSVSSKTL